MGPVVVTGAAGFIGAAFVHALVGDGCAVTAVVHPRTDAWRLADLTTRITLELTDLHDVATLSAAMRRAGPRLVIHAAAGGGHPTDRPGREAAWRDTVLATASLWDCLDGLGVERVVHLGSPLECAPDDRPLREDDPLAPETARGVLKAAALLTARQRAEELGVPVVVARVFSAYGPGEPGSRLVPTVLRCLRSGAPFRITAGTARRDFVHVDDVVDACLLAATRSLPAGEILNIGTGVETSNDELVALAEEVTGQTLVRDDRPFARRPADRAHCVADVTKTARLLGWRAGIGLADGLARTYATARAMAER